jgi:hypothetical protein
MCAISSTLVSGSLSDDGTRPRLHGIEGYHHADLALVHAMGRGLSQEPQAMLAHGTQSPILGEVEVRVISQLHLKHRHKKCHKPHN